MELQRGRQILKTRDDPDRLYLMANPESSDPQELYLLDDYQDCSWLNPGEAFGTQKLRSRIEPWLTALFQSEHLSMLVGSGLTLAVHGMTTEEPLPGMGSVTFRTFGEAIKAEATRVASAAKREDGNIEDQFRAASELLRGLEIAALSEASDSPLQEGTLALKKDLKDALVTFAASVLKGEFNLITADPEKREDAFRYLVSFLMSFASRSGTRERLHVFTTNYDRYIEAGADVAGLHLIDRFVGTLAPVFRSSRLDIDIHYNPPGIRGEPRLMEGVARFTKLHGSVDWVDREGQIQRTGLPFGAPAIEPYLATSRLINADALKLMIYPNAGKDRETASYPYVELFRDFAAAICRPNSTLVSYGFGFGDEHINRVIEDMLTIPSTHLVVISFSDPLGRIMEMYERLGRPGQITILMGNHLADLKTLVTNYLPKPAIDLTTIRMAELLQTRWSTEKTETNANGSPSTDEGV